jgi:hypothetical protein
MHSGRGTYALLLGSGLSSAAGILTGWEITLDLVRRVAAMSSDDCGADPAAWYRTKYGEEPQYSSLLDSLAKAPPDRQLLLRRYFEPTADDSEPGTKNPTRAHRAIADMVKRGYVRVILTTNFDRLLEQSIRDAGVAPSVISTPDAVDGALPLPHSSCTVVKVNGDYLDTRIKNTPSELAEYDERIKQLLDRIFDEFGLVVCGWSGEWDVGLRLAIERCPNRRFSTYWMVRDAASGHAAKLIEFRRGVQIVRPDADTFFVELVEKITSLEDVTQQHPLTSKIALATLNRYLVDDQHRIRLAELVKAEAERVVADLDKRSFDARATPSAHEVRARIHFYETVSATLRDLLISGAYWGKAQHRSLWATTIERVLNSRVVQGGGYKDWIRLNQYPTLILTYATCISALAADQYETIAAVLLNATEYPQDKALLTTVYASGVLEFGLAQKLPGMAESQHPASDYLYNSLREPFRALIPDNSLYQRVFDRFECLMTLLFADAMLENKTPTTWDGWVPWGAYYSRPNASWRGMLSQFPEEASAQGEDWKLFRAGFFAGHSERLSRAFDHAVRIISRLR